MGIAALQHVLTPNNIVKELGSTSTQARRVQTSYGVNLGFSRVAFHYHYYPDHCF